MTTTCTLSQTNCLNKFHAWWYLICMMEITSFSYCFLFYFVTEVFEITPVYQVTEIDQPQSVHLDVIQFYLFIQIWSNAIDNAFPEKSLLPFWVFLQESDGSRFGFWICIFSEVVELCFDTRQAWHCKNNWTSICWKRSNLCCLFQMLCTFMFLYHLLLFLRLLVQQLVEPVNWMKTIQNIMKQRTNVENIFAVGPGKQLKAMTSRIDRKMLNNFTNLET